MSDVLWAVAVGGAITVLGLWFNLGRPPRGVRLAVSGLAIVYFGFLGLIVCVAITALVWSFFA